jgi:hypothetical protein
MLLFHKILSSWTNCMNFEINISSRLISCLLQSIHYFLDRPFRLYASISILLGFIGSYILVPYFIDPSHSTHPFQHSHLHYIQFSFILLFHGPALWSIHCDRLITDLYILPFHFNGLRGSHVVQMFSYKIYKYPLLEYYTNYNLWAFYFLINK